MGPSTSSVRWMVALLAAGACMGALPAAHAGTRTWIDLDAWLARHGITEGRDAFGEDGDVLEDECQPLVIRAARADALLCPRREVTESDVVVSDEIWVASHGQLRRVFRVPVREVPLDADAAGVPFVGVRLEVAVDDTGAKLEVGEDPAATCEQAHARANELAAHRTTATLAGALERETGELCPARGRYVYVDGAFEREGTRKPHRRAHHHTHGRAS